MVLALGRRRFQRHRDSFCPQVSTYVTTGAVRSSPDSEEIYAPYGKRKSEPPGQDRQQGHLKGELLDDPTPGGAESGSNCKLLAPGHTPG